MICCFAIPCGDDTKLSPLASINPFRCELEPVTMLFCLCWLFLVCLVLCLCVLCAFGVFVYSTQDYVTVLHQFTFEPTQPQMAYVCLNSSINPILQHAIKHVERSGESHEGVGRKNAPRLPNKNKSSTKQLAPTVRKSFSNRLRSKGPP